MGEIRKHFDRPGGTVMSMVVLCCLLSKLELLFLETAQTAQTVSVELLAVALNGLWTGGQIEMCYFVFNIRRSLYMLVIQSGF